MSDNKPFCRCNAPEHWLSSQDVPIIFDAQMHEYHLVCGAPHSDFLVIYYCFFCGGKLPESRRSSYFVTPDMDETNEIAELMKGVTSITTMQEILGEPDQIVSSQDNQNFRARYFYQSKWVTLDLGIKEMLDGSIEYSLHPKSTTQDG